MTFTQHVAYVWNCDGCGAGVAEVDEDRSPSGWIHTMDGRDLCPECQP